MLLIIALLVTYNIVPDYLYVPLWLFIGVGYYLYKYEPEDMDE